VSINYLRKAKKKPRQDSKKLEVGAKVKWKPRGEGGFSNRLCGALGGERGGGTRINNQGKKTKKKNRKGHWDYAYCKKKKKKKKKPNGVYMEVATGKKG